MTETGLPKHIDHRFANTTVWMTQSLARYDDGVVGRWADVTNLKQAELVNQQQADLLRSVLDSSPNTIVALAAHKPDYGLSVRGAQRSKPPDHEWYRRNHSGKDLTIVLSAGN